MTGLYQWKHSAGAGPPLPEEPETASHLLQVPRRGPLTHHSPRHLSVFPDLWPDSRSGRPQRVNPWGGAVYTERTARFCPFLAPKLGEHVWERILKVLERWMRGEDNAGRSSICWCRCWADCGFNSLAQGAGNSCNTAWLVDWKPDLKVTNTKRSWNVRASLLCWGGRYLMD